MIITIRGIEYECRDAIKENNNIILFLGKYDERGNELTTVFFDFSDEDIDGLVIESEPTTDEILTALLGV